MMLLFKPELSFLRWCKVKKGTSLENKCKFKPDWYNKVIEDINIQILPVWKWLLS